MQANQGRGRRQVIVVNGERDWARFLPACDVHRVEIQSAGWVLRGGRLHVLNREGAWAPDAILWRVGAIRIDPRQLTALNLIRLSGVPCLTEPQALLRCYDRLAMRAELSEAEIPTLPFDASIGDHLAHRHRTPAPFVVKVGSHHGGLGKARVEDAGQWSELADLLFSADDYVTTEPYVHYTRDLRCLMVGDEVFGMERRGAGWRANVETLKARLIEPPEILVEWTRRFARHIGASSLALDALEDEEGRLVVLESNETPGFSGWPETLRHRLADLLIARLEALNPDEAG